MRRRSEVVRNLVTERGLQLLDLIKQLPLARIRARLAVLRQTLLAVLQKQPPPVRDRLLPDALPRRARPRRPTSRH